MAIVTKVQNYVGKQVIVEAGTTVNWNGTNFTQQRDSAVTVRSQELDRSSGRVRVFWKSLGYKASALV